MSNEWAAVIGVSVAVMAIVQVATIVALFVGVRRVQTSMQAIEGRVDNVVAEFRPQIARVVEEAREGAVKANELLTDIRRHLETMEDAARSMRHRVHRMVDGVSGVASAAGALPAPVKMSGPAAMALWAGMKVARSVVGRVRDRRRARHLRERQFREAESYIGIG